jgi:hypothetical protein
MLAFALGVGESGDVGMICHNIASACLR